MSDTSGGAPDSLPTTTSLSCGVVVDLMSKFGIMTGLVSITEMRWYPTQIVTQHALIGVPTPDILCCPYRLPRQARYG